MKLTPLTVQHPAVLHAEICALSRFPHRSRQRGDWTAWLSVGDSRNTARAVDTEALEWTTQWSEGGTESSSNDQHCVFPGTRGSAVCVSLSVHLTREIVFSQMHAAWRKRMVFFVVVVVRLLMLSKQSLCVISLVLQWSEVAWGDTDPAALWWMIPPWDAQFSSPFPSSAADAINYTFCFFKSHLNLFCWQQRSPTAKYIQWDT